MVEKSRGWQLLQDQLRRRHSKVQSSRSVALVFCCHSNDHLFVPKVPEGRHVEGHVGKDHQVLEEGEERVDWDGRMGGQKEPDYTTTGNDL